DRPRGPGRRRRRRPRGRGGDARRAARHVGGVPRAARSRAGARRVIRSRIAPMLRPQRRLIFGAGAAMVGATTVSLAAPLLTKIAIDRGITRHNVHVIDVIALLYVVLVLVRPVFERIVVLCSARV